MVTTVKGCGIEERPGRGRGYAALADREAVLAALTALIADAWDSFERPRPEEPAIDAEVLRAARRAAAGGAERPGDGARRRRADPRRVELTVAPALSRLHRLDRARGRGAGRGARGDLRRQPRGHRPRGRPGRGPGGRAGWPSSSAIDCAEGAFTSGGMISNLTGLLVARERALPGCRVDGFAGRQGAVYCSAESHHSVVRAAEAAGIGSAFVRLLDDRRAPAAAVDELDAALAADRDAGVVPDRRGRQRRHHAHRRRRPARRRSPTSASATASGCTSTAPTALPAAATETAGAAVRRARAGRLGDPRRPQVARACRRAAA